jgi:hypothetical protein
MLTKQHEAHHTPHQVLHSLWGMACVCVWLGGRGNQGGGCACCADEPNPQLGAHDRTASAPAPLPLTARGTSMEVALSAASSASSCRALIWVADGGGQRAARSRAQQATY